MFYHNSNRHNSFKMMAKLRATKNHNCLFKKNLHALDDKSGFSGSSIRFCL